MLRLGRDASPHSYQAKTFDEGQTELMMPVNSRWNQELMISRRWKDRKYGVRRSAALWIGRDRGRIIEGVGVLSGAGVKRGRAPHSKGRILLPPPNNNWRNRTSLTRYRFAGALGLVFS